MLTSHCITLQECKTAGRFGILHNTFLSQLQLNATMTSSVARIPGVSPGTGCVMASGTVTMEGMRLRDSAQVSSMYRDMPVELWSFVLVKQIDVHEENVGYWIITKGKVKSTIIEFTSYSHMLKGGYPTSPPTMLFIWTILYFLPGNGTCSGHSCGDGVCIPSDYVCDNYLDCRDASDEANCTSATFQNTFYPQQLPSRCPNSTSLIGM